MEMEYDIVLIYYFSIIVLLFYINVSVHLFNIFIKHELKMLW